MGLRACIVVCLTSFLLGSLFTHWIADSLTLWKSPVTDEHLWVAASYYAILAKVPIEILYCWVSVLALGAITIFWSLRDGEAGNLMFDGGSIFLYVVVIYMYSVIPNVLSKFTIVSSHQLQDPFPRSLRSPTLELASNNLISSVALTGVLVLQAGRLWAERADADDMEEEPTADDISDAKRRRE